MWKYSRVNDGSKKLTTIPNYDEESITKIIEYSGSLYGIIDHKLMWWNGNDSWIEVK